MKQKQDLTASKSLGMAQMSQPGLYVENNTIMLGGEPFYGIGTNYYNAYLRELTEPQCGDITDGIKGIAEYELPFIRARFSPWGDEGMEYFWNDRETYFKATDKLVSLCEQNKIGIIATLVWTTNSYHKDGWTFAELIEEPDSEGYRQMLAYMKAIITRYKNSPAIWGWEVGNEFNLGCDMHDTTLTADALKRFYSAVTPFIRKWDGTKRIISTGNSQNRYASWHLMNKREDWSYDNAEQQKYMAEMWKTPEISVNSIHVYNRTQVVDAEIKSVDEYLSFMVKISKQLGTPLFIGEYCDDERGKPETENDTEENSLKKFDVLHEAVMNNDVQLSCLWIFDRSTDDYTNPTDYNRHMLAKAQQGNKTYISNGKQKTDTYWENMTLVI